MGDKNLPSFPKLTQSLVDYIYDQEGNISRNKMLTVGSMIMLLSILYSTDVFARHSSHRSHSSHKSHSSGTSGYHSSHVSHQSHTSHSSGSGYYYSAGGGTSSYGGASYSQTATGVAANGADAVSVVGGSINPYAAIFNPLYLRTSPSYSSWPYMVAM